MKRLSCIKGFTTLFASTFLTRSLLANTNEVVKYSVLTEVISDAVIIMERVLSALESQQSGNATAALQTLSTIVHGLLLITCPNVLKKPLEQEYDFIVIGGGSGGATVASRMSDNPKWKVLLLEAGGEEPEILRVPGLVKTDGMFGTKVEWNFKTEPHPAYCNGKPCTYGRGKMLGGCDSHNGMWYLKGNRLLFDDFLERGIDGWSFDEIWPYYERRYFAHELQDDGTILDMCVEKFGYMDKNIDIIMKVYKEMGISDPDRNGNIREDYKTTSKNGTRMSANRVYLEKKRKKRKNLHVATEAFVTKILIDPETNTAYAVEALMTEDGKNEKVVIKARKEIFLCAGIINSPKLLQLSGVGPRELLEKFEIPVIKDARVGYNFLNHPVFRSLNLTLSTTSTIPPSFEAVIEDVKNYIRNKSGPLAATGAFNSYLLTSSSYSTKEVPDLLYSFNPFIEGLDIDDPKFCTCYYNRLNIGVMSGITNGTGTVFIKSLDPLEQPEIIPGLSPHDEDVMVEGCDLMYKMATSKTFKKNGIIADTTPDPRCKHIKYATSEYWRCAMKGKLDIWLHGMGTCSMGPKDDPNSVADNKCRVIGIKNLRVADASLCPNVTNANINSVVLMIGERCADFAIMEHL